MQIILLSSTSIKAWLHLITNFKCDSLKDTWILKYELRPKDPQKKWNFINYLTVFGQLAIQKEKGHA